MPSPAKENNVMNLKKKLKLVVSHVILSRKSVGATKVSFCSLCALSVLTPERIKHLCSEKVLKPLALINVSTLVW